MADPVWTFQYNFTNTPEQNGFTRFIHEPAPTVNLVTGGSPANRRIEVNTIGGGDISFLTSNVPSLNSALGITAEGLINVSGLGAAGFEARFLDFAISFSIYLNKITLERQGDVPLEVATAANNVDLLWRITYDGSNIRIYRAGVLVIGPEPPVLLPFPFQQFQFWAEGGGAVVYRQMKYFIAGAVAP